ncbi:hypothetical protein FS749_016182 [Ceratobasidium sp. UAMH 11750]|nr:hypothetical protein FS749_016182 [Ceratobasidium sp. UAMH 11750]
MDSLSLLRECLPNAKLESSERDMSNDFKAAAQSLAAFYKSSKQTVKHAHDAGYAACLQDMLQFIQTGLSTASSEDDVMGVARVMDWAEGQLERFRAGAEFERKSSTIEETAAPTTASTSTAQRSFSPPRRATEETKSPIQTPRKLDVLPPAPEPAPIPAPLFATEATPATKRRHAAITSVDAPLARRRSRAFALPVAPGPSDTRQARRGKRGVPDRERSIIVESRGSDSMDFEEDGPRERKRSRTSRADPTSPST